MEIKVLNYPHYVKVTRLKTVSYVTVVNPPGARERESEWEDREEEEEWVTRHLSAVEYIYEYNMSDVDKENFRAGK